ncbi:MAG: metal-sensing transcriptional repressor [Eubacteriales bacterium]|nr:metal-sensing transcriptional repressor [Eubacteriales bacterium]
MTETGNSVTGNHQEAEAHTHSSCSSGSCPHCHYKHTPRDPESLRQLQNRLNRIIGQLGGIKTMLDDNRYCGDILTQIAAAESALQSLGHLILQEHMETCVVEEIRSGNTEIMDEALTLIKKLK